MGPARAYFPLVGLALGGILAGLDFAARQALPAPVVGALLVVALLVKTRAIHTEGFLDSCDGLFGGYSRAKRLQILRDTHVGAFRRGWRSRPAVIEVDSLGRHTRRDPCWPANPVPVPFPVWYVVDYVSLFLC